MGPAMEYDQHTQYLPVREKTSLSWKLSVLNSFLVSGEEFLPSSLLLDGTFEWHELVQASVTAATVCELTDLLIISVGHFERVGHQYLAPV